MKNRFTNPRSLVAAITGSLFLLALSFSARGEDVSGTWKWTINTPNGNMIDSTLALKQDGETLSGIYKSTRGGESKIEEGKISGNKISFKVKRELQSNTFVIIYKGELQTDRIEGSISVKDSDRTFEWHAKREASPSDLTGKWAWTVETPNGDTIKASLNLKIQGPSVTGKLVGDEWEIEIQEGQTKGDHLEFTAKRESDSGRTITYKSEGTISGNTISGTVSFKGQDGEDRTLKWKATR